MVGSKGLELEATVGFTTVAPAVISCAARSAPWPAGNVRSRFTEARKSQVAAPAPSGVMYSLPADRQTLRILDSSRLLQDQFLWEQQPLVKWWGIQDLRLHPTFGVPLSTKLPGPSLFFNSSSDSRSALAVEAMVISAVVAVRKRIRCKEGS